MKLTQPIRDRDHVYALAAYYLQRGQIRNHVLIVVSLYTALRISDILRLTWDDVYNFKTQQFRTSVTITEKKTKKPKIFALNQEIVSALNHFISEATPGAYLIENKRTGKAIDRTQAYRIIRAAGEAIGLDQNISCHSLRKTYGYHAWKNGAPQPILMVIFNHASWKTTEIYLGIRQDDVNEQYLNHKY